MLYQFLEEIPEGTGEEVMLASGMCGMQSLIELGMSSAWAEET